MNKPGPTLNPQMGSSDMVSSNQLRDLGLRGGMCRPGHTAVLGGWDQSPRSFPSTCCPRAVRALGTVVREGQAVLPVLKHSGGGGGDGGPRQESHRSPDLGKWSY